MIVKNRLLLTLLLAVFSMWTAAQEEEVERRGRIEHVGGGQVHAATGKRRVGSVATAPLTCMGSPKVPVILVQFPDKSFTAGETDEEVQKIFDEFFNAEEGVHPSNSYCSVREYFRTQSDGQFTPQFDVIGPVTLSSSYAYYGEDRGGAKDVNITAFYREACKLVVQNDVDWTKFDNDGNGTVDLVFFIYAGHGQNQNGIESGAIWPKENMSGLTVQSEEGEDGERFTVTFGAYGCTNELYKGMVDGIGACAHELCHGLGLPDFYDYNYMAYGMDYWDLMDMGCYKINGRMPIGLSAYERDFFGWKKLVELTPDSAYSLTLLPLEEDGMGYKVVNKANENEYFILENRQNIGSDGYLGWAISSQYAKYGANHGLMITHVDYNASAWNGNTINYHTNHQRFTLVPADKELVSSNFHTDSIWALSTHGDLYPGDSLVTEMTSYDVFTGNTLGQTIDNIAETEDGIVTLDINGGKATKPEEDPEEGLYEPDIPELR